MVNLSDWLSERTPNWGDKYALGRAIGVSNGTISRWARGDAKRITFENCLRIALHYGSDPQDIFRMADKEDYLDLYRHFLKDYKPKKLTSTDIYPTDHAAFHDMLESILESECGTDLDLVTGLLKSIDEKVRLSHRSQAKRHGRTTAV